MISDIPDEVIDVDFNTIKELFTIPAWQQLMEKGIKSNNTTDIYNTVLLLLHFSGGKENAVAVQCMSKDTTRRDGDV